MFKVVQVLCLVFPPKGGLKTLHLTFDLSNKAKQWVIMAYVLPRLTTKKEVDGAIKRTEDKVLVLRFGREADSICMQLDEIVSAPP